MNGTMAIALSLLAQAAPGSQGDMAFFEKNIRPILVERCYECHSAETQKIKGGLALDSKPALRKGGDRGPAVEPGHPDKSLLIDAVRYTDDDLKMPPKGKLSDREIGLLSQWVKMGAPDPRTAEAAARPKGRPPIDLDAGRKFWAFRPPTKPVTPDVKDRDWARSDIDRFVLASLESKGIHPVAPADKRTLIRRATLDLTGLPPTPEEVEAFVNDSSKDAFAKVIDRLLASPHYGERWGRHWLDVARYSDSNGLDENVAHGNAWRYRDYVVKSFNDDTPFDRFLTEQLAGDLMPEAKDDATRHARLVATGFLALGPKVLAEVDETKMEMDIVDEQIDTVSRAFLGLTIACARCHDHKFDPIRTVDYYGLAGIFKSTRTMENFKKVAKWHENTIATAADLAAKAEHEKLVAAKKVEVASLVNAANRALLASQKPDFKLPKDPEPLFPAETRNALQARRDELTALEKKGFELPSAMGVQEGTPTDVRVHIRGSHLSLGESTTRGVPAVLTPSGSDRSGTKGSGRLDLAKWLTDRKHPLTARVTVNRIWRWHFGRGLVGSTDNFGALGERPTHPELLDWLATTFIDDGWSVKALHRRIMLSSTYQEASTFDEKAAAVDPEDRLHWRFRPRRLEAEAIRDAVLAVSGELDRTIGGSLLQVKNRDYFFDHTSIDRTKYDMPRRSLYLPVVRNHMYDVFDLFDYTESSVATGDRATTTVAPQALFLLNGDVMVQAAADLAKQLLACRCDDAGRVDQLYRIAYGRPPQAKESERALAFLDRYAKAASDRGSAWRGLCHTLLASNEFVYLR